MTTSPTDPPAETQPEPSTPSLPTTTEVAKIAKDIDAILFLLVNLEKTVKKNCAELEKLIPTTSPTTPTDPQPASEALQEEEGEDEPEPEPEVITPEKFQRMAGDLDKAVTSVISLGIHVRNMCKIFKEHAVSPEEDPSEEEEDHKGDEAEQPPDRS